MKVYRGPQIYLIFLTCLLTLNCKNEKAVDVSHIPVNIAIERFDKELIKLTPAQISSRAPQLKQKYGHFYVDYMENMLGLGSAADSSYYRQLRTVLTNKDYNELASEVNRTFPDLKKQEEELEDAFKHILYYFPQTKVPRIISYFSGFAVQTPVGNDYVGMGLDMFLGRDSRFYPALVQSIPQYISRRFTPENITPRIIEGFIREDMFPDEDENRSLLSKMVYHGKILYMMESVMPNVADSLHIGYSAEQMKWADTYRPEVWAYFLENNLLYENDYMKMQKYLTDAPFTPGIGTDSKSAPKLAIYTGWQIVRKFMENNPDLSLKQLMEESDPQKILKGSKYKPR